MARRSAFLRGLLLLLGVMLALRLSLSPARANAVEVPGDATGARLQALRADCGKRTAALAAGRTASGAQRDAVLQRAVCELGRPYRYGGEGRRGFDCSGFVQHVFAGVGRSLPRTTEAQFRAGARIALRNAEPGDLVFFRIGRGMHVGVYAGDGYMIHAPSSGKRVMLSRMDTPYWTGYYAGAVRILPQGSSAQ